jgi:hypothetical protein
MLLTALKQRKDAPRPAWLSTILIDSVPLEVTDLGCELAPPHGPAKLRFSCASGNHLEFQRDVRIDFQIGTASYRGTFRVTHCTLAPGRWDYEYSSVGRVDKTG